MAACGGHPLGTVTTLPVGEVSVRAAGCHSFTSCLRFSYSPFHFQRLPSTHSSASFSSSLLYEIIYILLTAIGLKPGGSSTVHTDKQNTEEHNEREYPEQNTHNNKNTET